MLLASFTTWKVILVWIFERKIIASTKVFRNLESSELALKNDEYQISWGNDILKRSVTKWLIKSKLWGPHHINHLTVLSLILYFWENLRYRRKSSTEKYEFKNQKRPVGNLTYINIYRVFTIVNEVNRSQINKYKTTR